VGQRKGVSSKDETFVAIKGGKKGRKTVELGPEFFPVILLGGRASQLFLCLFLPHIAKKMDRQGEER